MPLALAVGPWQDPPCGPQGALGRKMPCPSPSLGEMPAEEGPGGGRRCPPSPRSRGGSCRDVASVSPRSPSVALTREEPSLAHQPRSSGCCVRGYPQPQQSGGSRCRVILRAGHRPLTGGAQQIRTESSNELMKRFLTPSVLPEPGNGSPALLPRNHHVMGNHNGENRPLGLR